MSLHDVVGVVVDVAATLEELSCAEYGFQVGFAGLGAAILPGVFGLATEPFGLEAIGYGLVINAVVLLALERWVAARYSARAG
mgnify:CR=1 FL=1